MISRFQIFAVLFMLLIAANLRGQMYNTAGGIRIADDVGFTLSQRLFGKTTVEFALQPGFFQKDASGHMLLRRHYSLVTKRLNVLLGAGTAFRESGLQDNTNQPDALLWGGSVQGGAELTLGRFNVSIDYTPSFYKSQQQSGFDWKVDKSVSIRYVFWKKPSKIKSIFRKKKG